MRKIECPYCLSDRVNVFDEVNKAKCWNCLKAWDISKIKAWRARRRMR